MTEWKSLSDCPFLHLKNLTQPLGLPQKPNQVPQQYLTPHSHHLLGEDDNDEWEISAEYSSGENRQRPPADPATSRPVTRSYSGNLPGPKNILTSDILGEVRNSYIVLNDFDSSMCVCRLFRK